MKNRYIFRYRVSEAQFRRITRLFSLDLNAVQVDESYSGARRIKGKRGRGTLDSVIYSDGWRGYDGSYDVIKIFPPNARIKINP